MVIAATAASWWVTAARSHITGPGIPRLALGLSWFSWRERQPGTDGYRFLRAADLAASAAFFFWSALSAWACFWFVFFWLDFGDRSPIILIFLPRVDHLRHVSFSEGTFILPAGVVIVNAGRKIIRPG